MLFKDTNLGRLILESIPMEKAANKKSNFDTAEAVKIADGLSKVASYPYSEKVYQSVQEMMKIASECLYNLKSAFDQAVEKKASLEKAAEVRCIVEDMALNGLVGEYDVHEKVAELMSKNTHQLEVIKEATKLASGGKSGNVFSTEDNSPSSKGSNKRGMFDTVIA
jgi:hypothetical protein